jgi:hypothetical protein
MDNISEGYLYTPQTESLRNSYIENPWAPTMFVNADSVAAGKWPEMLAETQKDLRERGVVVSRSGDKIITSKIFTGVAEGEISERHRAHITMPILSQGLRSLLPKTKDITFVHTHSMPPQLNHLQTTIVSDADILSFIRSELNGLVVVDRGGAHLLVRTRETYGQKPSWRENTVNEIIAKSIKAQGSVMNAMTAVANELQKSGLGYYFSPTSQSTSSNEILFHNLLQSN